MFTRIRKPILSAFFIALLVFGLLSFGVDHVLADAGGDTFGVQTFENDIALEGGTDIRIIIARVINVVLSLLGIIAVSLMVYAGYVWMTAGGNDERIATAKKIMINATIGLAIILSSFAITTFILNRLSEATGTLVEVPDACSDPVYASDPANFEECSGIDVGSGGINCDTFPILCAENKFYIKSITARTDNTQMNNVVVRVVLSKPLSAESMKKGFYFGVVGSNGGSVPAYTYQILGDNNVIQGTFASPLPQGNYSVDVRVDLSAADGSGLEENFVLNGKTYPDKAFFKVGTNGVIDTTAPQASPLLVNGKSDTPVLVAGELYAVQNELTDNSGIGYTRLSITPDGQAPTSYLFDGPPVFRGSDAPASNPYLYTSPLFFAKNTELPSLFTLKQTTFDIDSNQVSTEANVIVVGDQCDEFGAPVDPEFADACLSDPGGSCSADWQCISGVCDEDAGVCLSYPIITEVSPWDGAAGNWITVMGKFFGEAEGTVEFGYDQNESGAIEDGEWIIASTPDQCADVDTWNDGWVIVELPSDALLPEGSKSAVRIRRADEPDFFDTTINDRGPQPGEGNFVGYVTKNNTTRPGLCQVVVATGAALAGSTSAPPETPIVAVGNGFGSSPASVIFGGSVPAPVTSWTNSLIESAVPQNMNAGTVAVTVVDANGESSNGVPFTVSQTSDTLLPVIESIAPPETTKESFVTISGQRFGNVLGDIWMASDSETAKLCATPGSDLPEGAVCYSLDASAFAQCSVTWSNTQIIAYVGDVPAGTYSVVVRTGNNGWLSDGTDQLVVTDGPPRPSICSLVPLSGPAPLPSGHPGLVFGGKNFNASEDPTTVYFWRRNADPLDVTTWLTSLPSTNPNTTIDTGSFSDTTLITTIPQENGLSMDTGPIRIFENGQFSNPVTYTVGDCREGSTAPGADYHCCTQGIDAGLWKPNGYVCEGETRSAGYVWRFTTGKAPQVPFVIESCNQENWLDDNQIDYPSPVPSTLWVSGNNACVNANIAIRFSMEMLSDSIDARSVVNPGNILVEKCVQENGELSCLETVPSESLALDYESQVLTIWDGTENLDPNTWYRVSLSANIHAYYTESIAGTEVEQFVPLQVTRPCGDGTAYCFEFKTSNVGEECVLSSAFIQPGSHKTNALGDIRDIFENPFYFYVKGKASQECIVLNVDGLGWNWSEANSALVDASNAPLAGKYSDTRATAFAGANTAPESSDIYASVKYAQQISGDTVSVDIEASSAITVDLGEPSILDYWQNCANACVNTGVGAAFSIQMDPSTFADGFAFFECLDGEACQNKEQQAMLMGIDPALSHGKKLIANLIGSQLLKPNRWYVVELSDEIKAVGGYDTNGDVLQGESLVPFSWKFKTKNDDSPCVVDSVSVNPLSYIETVVGRKRIYSAQAKGAPDNCSPYGQQLNPWGFDWEWQSTDPEVATISNFANAGTIAPWCGLDCTPAGSDYARQPSFVPNDPTTLPPLCGNGIVDDGEDCDIGSGTGILACNYDCTFKGGVSIGCGNGIVQEIFGEECDYDANNPDTAQYLINGEVVTGPAQYCSTSCLNTGSSQEETGVLNAPLCGSGEITPGEDCDINDPNSAQGCSASCQHLGTPLTQEYCDILSAAGASLPALCSSAASVCGNGVLEMGEECEIGIDGATSAQCSNRCLLVGNVCGTALEQCEAGNDGCSAFCLYEGSSLEHDVPSFCGDGMIGIGEFSGCDVPTSEQGFGRPIQIATAYGQSSAIDAVTQAQQTFIQASTVNASSGNGNISLAGTEEIGQGTYYLQCGFEEYDTPLEQNDETFFNGCSDTAYGVANNSCCYPRPTRIDSYPADGAGLNLEPIAGVCRNTYIEATLDERIDQDTINGNILIAEYHDGAYDCAANGLIDVTQDGVGAIAKVDTPQSSDQESTGFFQGMWRRIKGFFGGFFAGPVFADELPYTLCSGGISAATSVIEENITSDDGVEAVHSKIIIALSSLLKENTTYAVILQGGSAGIKDVRGVGIKHPTEMVLNDGWLFKTGSAVCKLNEVSVEPASYQFSLPFDDHSFVAAGTSFSGASIVSIPGVYEWEWSWIPAQNPLFDVPTEQTPADEATISISSRNLEGALSVYAQAKVVADLDTATQNHLGKTFSGRTDLFANFCLNIWPAREGSEWKPYIDDEYNFSFSYCADAGSSATTEDDLPFFTIIPVSTEPITVETENVGSCVYDTINIATPGVPFPQTNENQSCVADSQCVTDLATLGIDVNDICSDTSFLCTSGDIQLLNQPCANANDCILPGSETKDATCEDKKVSSQKVCLAGPRSNQACNSYEDCLYPVSGSCTGSTDIENLPGADLPNDVLKKYLMFNDTNDDVIGIQIFKNPERLTLAEWYATKFNNLGALTSLEIDGYEGLTDGLNYYVHALNESDNGNTRSLYNNIYLFSLNLGAQQQTQDVFDQVIQSVLFNINIADDAYCLAEGSSLLDQSPAITNIQCSTDFDCRAQNGLPLDGSAGYCANARTKLLRDWERVYDIREIQTRVNAYAASNNGTAPPLSSGTYFPTYSTSRWPSWQEGLGKALTFQNGGLVSLPVDPINSWSSCGQEGTNQQTCWNAQEALYHCPYFEQVYEYAYNQNTKQYRLYGTLEYIDDSLLGIGGVPVINEFVDTNFFVNDRWCEPETVTSPFGATCGDGVVQKPAETCEIGDTIETACTTADGGSGYWTSSCNATCTGYELNSACTVTAQCGNGIVDEGESCDDGALNGQYGQCSLSCQQASAAYCGNGQIDYQVNQNGTLGAPLEYCDANASLGGICEYVTDNGTPIKPQVRIVLDRSVSMKTCPDGSGDNTVNGKWCNGKVNDPESKWEQAKDGVLNIIANLNSSIDIDVTVYSAAGLDPQGCYLNLGTSADLEDINPAGTSPTANVISGIANNIDTIFDGDPEAPRMVVLITDGVPADEKAAYLGYECLGNTVESTQAAITSLTNAGIETYVVGFGDLPDHLKANLDLFAEAGNTNNFNNELHRYYDASSEGELVSIFGDILGCSPYNQFERASCAYDCQSSGSYCGDGVVDAAFGEECDDGNDIGTDICSNSCTFVDQSIAPQVPIPGGQCGDGILNQGEACDLGSQNGVVPDPDSLAYNTSQTFCSLDCSDVLTIESAQMCGNGVRDWNDLNGNGSPDAGEWLEACDSIGLAQVDISGDGVADSCGSEPYQYGAYQCSNSCQTLVNNCTTCAPVVLANYSEASNPKAVPYLSIINPMLGNNVSGDGDWGNQNSVSLKWYTWPPFIGENEGVFGSSYKNHRLTVDSGTQTLYFPTDNVCTGEYTYFFNGENEGSTFVYPVSGETSQINHEMVLSPAIPQGSFRIVARWTDAEAAESVLFSVNSYSEAFATQLGPSVVSYLTQQSKKAGICNLMTYQNAGIFGGHWGPSELCAPAKVAAETEFYVHPFGSLTETYTHAQTIGVKTETDEPVALFIEALSPSVSGRPIAEFKNSELVVEVYGDHPDDDTLGLGNLNGKTAIVEPNYVFRIKDVPASSSSNSGARYWHVLNLVRENGWYRVYPVMEIETSLCSLRNNIPGDSCDTSNL